MRTILLVALTVLPCVHSALGHALPTQAISGPLRVRGNDLVDGSGFEVQLTGANVPESVLHRKSNDALFRVMRRRWNFNTVRLPVSVAAWRRDGDSYLEAVARVVQEANGANLAVVMVAIENTTLPSPDTQRFWATVARRFEGNDRIIFDVFDKPSSATIPRTSPARRGASDWEFWLNGGTTLDGKAAIGMKQLVETIRATGARQVIAVQAFSDVFGFTALQPAHWIPDQNVIYEIHPYFDRAITPDQRQSTFEFLAGSLHLYAGEWGFPLTQDTESCRAIPADIGRAVNLFWETISYFSQRGISWTASSFEAGSLVLDYESFANTTLHRPWSCGEKTDPAAGIGELLLVAMTGDSTGFGQLTPEFFANAANGSGGPIAPGEIVTIYGVEFGPDPGVQALLDASGKLPTALGSVQVTFDGVPAPLFFVSAYQLNLQVPYTVAGKTSTEVQLIYDGLASTPIDVPVVEAAPGIFADFSRFAKAINQDGTVNSPATPASRGSIVVLFATGAGEVSTNRPAGELAAGPLGVPRFPASVSIGSRPAEILYAGEAPGLIGVLQLNVRVPGVPLNQAVSQSVDLSIGPHSSTFPVSIWVR